MNDDREPIRSANALRVFEAAARHLGFTAAASELHVTQVAVSRMVARLEDSLDLRLFVRSRNGLQLTEEGAILYAAVAEGFGRMETALRDLRRRRASRSTVTLSLSSGFTSHWLMPRFAQFQEAVPGIHLRFQLTGAILQGDVDSVDLGMRMHAPGHVGQSWRLCPEVVVPLCSPGYLSRRGPLDAASGALRHTLIHLTTTTMTWDSYGARAGLSVMSSGDAMSFSDSALVLQAALLGQGVALGWLSAASGAIRDGLLVPAAPQMIRTGREYCLVAGPAPLRDEVAQVRAWLQSEMQRDLIAIQQIPGLNGLVQPGDLV